jgi:hypothetical protein
VKTFITQIDNGTIDGDLSRWVFFKPYINEDNVEEE